MFERLKRLFRREEALDLSDLGFALCGPGITSGGSNSTLTINGSGPAKGEDPKVAEKKLLQRYGFLPADGPARTPALQDMTGKLLAKHQADTLNPGAGRRSTFLTTPLARETEWMKREQRNADPMNMPNPYKPKK